MQTRYSRGKIYLVRNDVDEQVYVGCTCDNIYRRMYSHRSEAKIAPELKLHELMNKLGSKLFYTELYEEYSCDNKEQLDRRRGQVERELGATLNKRVEGEVVCADKKEELREYHRKYFEERSDKVECKVCGCMVTRFDLKQHERTQKHLRNVEKLKEVETNRNVI